MALSILCNSTAAQATTSTTSYVHKNCGGVIKEVSFTSGSSSSTYQSGVPHEIRPESSWGGNSGTHTLYCSYCGQQVGGGGWGTDSTGHTGGSVSWGAHTCYFCEKCGAKDIASENYFAPFNYTINFNKNY